MALPAGNKTTRNNILFWLVFLLGALGATPFGIAIWRLLDYCGAWISPNTRNDFGHPYVMALHASLALMCAGVVLCVLLLFYRIRNDDAAPKMTSGLLVIAAGALLTAVVLLAARGQLPMSPR
jgi:hypothetical protein